MNILFLCTGNSARSIIAEAIYNHVHKQHGYGHAFSAGSKPVGKVNPYALQTLTRHGIPTYDAISKPLSDFLGENAPTMDYVISVCDEAAKECPIWPERKDGTPAKRLHWSIPDPAAVKGTDEEIVAAFEAAYRYIHGRIEYFVKKEFQT